MTSSSSEKDTVIIKEDWTQFSSETWPLRRSSIGDSHHLLNDDIRTTLLLNVVDKTEPDKSLDIYKATIFESRLDSSIFYQKPVDEVILVQESSDMKRPSTSSLSSSPSDLVYPRKKRLRTKKRVVIGKTHNKLEEAICNEAEIQQNGDENETEEAEAEPEDQAKLQPLLTHNSEKKPGKEPELDIEEKILRRREMAHLFQWYYPEGGWGWVILVCAFISQSLAHGLQLGFAYPLGIAIRRRFYLPETEETFSNETSNHDTISSDYSEPNNQRHIEANHIGCLAAFGFSFSLVLSPLVMAFCRRRSTRLAAVCGGLVLSLGVLFTSFATKFYQLFFSYGTVIGLGICLVRDSNSSMLGQYFKKKRALVEMILGCSSGLGLPLISQFVWRAIKSLGWRYGLHLMAVVFFGPFFLGTFYRSATLYHPQRRAIIHLKNQQKAQILQRVATAKTRNTKIKDLKAYKDRSLHLAFLASILAGMGIFTPFVNLIQKAFDEDQLTYSDAAYLQIQAYLGSSWILGTLLFGFILILKPKGCQITKLYLSIFSLIICGLTSFLADSVHGESGHIVFALIYGTFSGGFFYAFKLHIFDLSHSRNFNRTWPYFLMAQGLGSAVGVPTMNHYLSGFMLFFASFLLVMSDRYKAHLLAIKKHKEHLEKYHLDPDHANETCQSLMEQDQQKERKRDDDEDSEDISDAENDPNFTDSLMEIYKNRHKSPENMLKWQQIEKELFNETIKKDDENQVPLEPLDQNHVEPSAKINIPNKPDKPVNRQMSADEGCYMSTSNSSSSGSGSGKLAKYKMSAAISQAMVTAAIPVAHHPGENPGSRVIIPEIQALRSGPREKWLHKQRSITVIEEVSA